MTLENRINDTKMRIKKLESRGDKNKKCPGVLNRLKSELRTMEKELNNK